MTQRDAVDVAADARTIAKRIVNEHIRGERPSITHSDMVDAIAEAHRSASNSGAEAMREAVLAKVAEAQAAMEALEGDAAELAAAALGMLGVDIRALPTPPASKDT